MLVTRFDYREFLSTLPVRGATENRLPTGISMLFLSTLPVRGATFRDFHFGFISRFLSTLPVRGATVRQRRVHGGQGISIHAPREGSDRTVTSNFARPTFLSTLPVRGATDKLAPKLIRRAKFLSTLPVRGATRGQQGNALRGEISIHAPREGSDQHPLRWHCPSRMISIHAPREGSDRELLISAAATPRFLSTLPVRGATLERKTRLRTRLFLSTLPVRGATKSTLYFPKALLFLSTLPVRGATQRRKAAGHLHRISIHAPREGSDRRALDEHIRADDISIHAPREGSDIIKDPALVADVEFLSTLPVRGATQPKADRGLPGQDFYPRSP